MKSGSPRLDRRPARARFAATVALILAAFLPSPLRAQDAPEPAGVLVYRMQPWHKATEAKVKEYLKARQFAAVVWVTDLNGKERRMQRALVFEVHDYLPFDATDTEDAPLNERIDRELEALRALGREYPGTKVFVEPRIAKWETLRASAPAASPTPAATPKPTATGRFHDTQLPSGGALGLIRLKNGEEFRAWITALTPETLKWDEPVEEGSGVYQERSLPMDEVQSLQVFTAEDVARSQFQKLEVPKTSLTVAAYQVLYQHYFRLLDKMKAQFGADPRYAEWHSDIIQIREDLQQAQSTQSLRIDGRWLTREEMQENAYENAAAVLWASARQMMELSRWTLVVEYCRELQTKYPGSRAFVENIPAIRKWLDSFGKDRTSLRALGDRPGIAEQAKAVLAHIEKFDLDAAERSLELSAKAKDAIGRRNRAEAERLIAESAEAWPQNAELPVLRKRLQALPVPQQAQP